MISIAVCDDAKIIVDNMETLLKKYSAEIGEEIRVSKFYLGDSLLDQYKSNYDIIFLDIKMPGLTGIQTAERIRKKDDKVTIIFLTSLIDNAIEGYKVQAANYIIKPLGYKRLKIELDNWQLKIRDKNEQYITIHNDSGNYKVLLKSIRYIETYNRNLLVHAGKENIICYRKLKDMESELAKYGFARCHSSFLLNMLYVEKIEKTDIQLFTGERIPVSKTKKKVFMENIAEYWGKLV